jgi:hypothetical protein
MCAAGAADSRCPKTAWHACRALDPLVVAAVVLVFHWRAVRPGWAFAEGDIRYFFLAARDAVQCALREGRLPLWERGSYVGYPLVADPQVALFDFTTWLTLPWDAARALTLGTLVHLVVMALGMQLWMRLRGLGRAQAVLAAIIFVLGAKQTVHLHHWTFAAATAWWPWMLAGVDGFAISARARWLILVACATAACWFGGSPQMAHFGLLLVGGFAVAHAPALWRRRRRDPFLLAAAIILGTTMALPEILPAAQLAAYGPRGGSGLGYSFAATYGWADRYGLALLLLPGSFGGEAWTTVTNPWEATGYVGILPIALVFAAPVRRNRVAFFAFGAILGVWLSFGRYAWLDLHRVAYAVIPGFSSFRVPTRALMVTSLCVAVLAAEGMNSLSTRGLSVGAAWRLGGILLAVIVAAHVLPRLPSFSLDRASGTTFAWRATAVAALGLLWIRMVHREGMRPRWAVALCCFCWVDQYGAFGSSNTVMRAEALTPAFEAVLPALPTAQGSRVAVFTERAIEYNEAQRVRRESPTGYGPSIIERVRRIIEWTRSGTLALQSGVNVILPEGDPQSTRWRLLATSSVITRAPLVPEHVVVDTKNGPVILQGAPALPRVYWAGSFVQHGDAGIETFLEDAARGDQVVIAEPAPFHAGERSGPVPAEDVAVGPRTLSAVVDAPREGVVVVLDPWFPGWSASVDGEAAAILRANYAFQAVAVSRGRHRIVLSYENRPFVLGCALAAVGATALLALALIARAGRAVPGLGDPNHDQRTMPDDEQRRAHSHTPCT